MSSPDAPQGYPSVTDRSEEVQAALGLAGVAWAIRETEEVEPFTPKRVLDTADPAFDILQVMVD